MKTRTASFLARTGSVLTAFLVLLFSVPVAFGQHDAPQRSSPQFAQQELDQILAPIALYPDALLSQILMAATYPGEVVEAARWSRRNPDLAGDRAVREAERMDWDPSVKSLVAFPQILGMLDEKRDWMEDLGDAFLDQQAQVMDTVQYLRQKAYAAGNLRSTEQFRVDSEGSTFSITLANPEIVYLPYYNPTVVYGTWWWSSHQPVYWAPWPGYYSRPGYARGFAWGPGIPVARGFFFSAPDWHRRSVNIVNVNSYYYRPPEIARNSGGIAPGASNAWQHDMNRRRDVPQREASWRPQSSQPGAAPAVQQHEGRGSFGKRDDARVDNGNRREERGGPQPPVAGHGLRPDTERAPAGTVQPVVRSAPSLANMPPAAVSRPAVEQRATPPASNYGAREREGHNPVARARDASSGEGRGWSGHRPDARADSGGRSEERSQHVVASVGAAPNVGRGSGSANPPPAVNQSEARSAPAQLNAPIAANRPNAAPPPNIANAAAGSVRRPEPRNAGPQPTAQADSSAAATSPSSSASASQSGGSPRSGSGNPRHP